MMFCALDKSWLPSVPTLALPLIVLPDISPRIETGRKTPSRMVSPIVNLAKRALTAATAPSPRHYTGRRCRQADEGQR